MTDLDCRGAGSQFSPGEGHFAALLRQAEPSLSDHQLRQLSQYRDALFEHNKITNLTAVRDVRGIEHRLILESLRLVRPMLSVIDPDHAPAASVLDIGTGGGIPGLVLAVSLPRIQFTLLDATGKKIAFIQTLIENVGLDNVRTIHGRAEEIGRDPDLRGTYSVAVARAVSSLPALIELGLPMLKPGGHLLFPKGNDIADELRSGHIAASILGGEIVEAPLLPNVGSYIETRLVIVRKTAPTPGAYPRRSGIPSRDPLSTSSRKSQTGM